MGQGSKWGDVGQKAADRESGGGCLQVPCEHGTEKDLGSLRVVDKLLSHCFYPGMQPHWSLR